MERNDVSASNRDLMDRLLASDTYSPVQKVAHIPDPEAALEQLLHTPGVTQADIEFARDWVVREKERRLTLVRDWMEERHASNEAQARNVDERIFAVNQEANDVKDRVRRHQYGSVREVASELKGLRMELVSLGRLIDSIEQREQMINAHAADPVGTFNSLYERYPTLAGNLPSLWDALSDHNDARTRPPLRHTSF